MRWEQIEILLDLKNTHSFNQTAEHFYTTPQNISYSIKQLENELGIQIFHRCQNGVFFTGEGRHVLRFAEQSMPFYLEMQKNIAQAKEDLQEIQTLKRLSLQISSVLLTGKIPSIKKKFSKKFPETALAIKEGGKTSMIQDLSENKCDVAVWCINQSFFEEQIKYLPQEKFRYEILSEDKVVLVLSAKSSLAKKSAALSREDIANVPKSLFGLLPLEQEHLSDYAEYEDDNPAVHQHIIGDEGGVCFMTQKTQLAYFNSDKYVVKEYAASISPIYHVLFYRIDVQHPAYLMLSKIIKMYF